MNLHCVVCQKPINELKEGMLSWSEEAPFSFKLTHKPFFSPGCDQDKSRLWIDLTRVKNRDERERFLRHCAEQGAAVKDLLPVLPAILLDFEAPSPLAR